MSCIAGRFISKFAIPNLLRIETSSGRNAYIVISDGKVMTIYNPKQRKFAQTTAPRFTRCCVWFAFRRNRCRAQVLDFLRVVDDVVAGSDDIKVAAAGSAAILRRLMRLPVLGLARWSRFAKATVRGRNSTCGLRPSHFPFSWRTRSRACRSLETRRAFSYSAKAPAILYEKVSAVAS